MSPGSFTCFQWRFDVSRGLPNFTQKKGFENETESFQEMYSGASFCNWTHDFRIRHPRPGQDAWKSRFGLCAHRYGAHRIHIGGCGRHGGLAHPFPTENIRSAIKVTFELCKRELRHAPPRHTFDLYRSDSFYSWYHSVFCVAEFSSELEPGDSGNKLNFRFNIWPGRTKLL